MTVVFQPVSFWAMIPPKALRKFYKPEYGGRITEEEVPNHATLVIGKQGHMVMGNILVFYWVVDQTNGTLIDTKFQYFGHPYLCMLAETTCSLLIGKTYAQAYKFSVNDIDQELRTASYFSEQHLSLYHMVIDAIDTAIEQCMHIPTADGTTLTKELFLPLQAEDANPFSTEQWEKLSPQERLLAIRTTTETKIAPYVALDGGGVSIDQLEGNEVTISYSGNCTSCYSAIGGTLRSIEQCLRAYVYSDLHVKVSPSSLSPS